jgi:hypothetical protein
MTAYRLLLHELARSGGRTTYAALQRRYGTLFDANSFAVAVYKARQRGVVVDDGGRGKPIVAVGCCPCCGRKL